MLVGSSLLKTGVTSANFFSHGILPNSTDLVNSWCKIDVKMSILSLTIFVRMPEFATDLEEPSLFNSFFISVCLMLLSRKACFYFCNDI